MHRDISEGNIILLGGNDGVRAKLSDLEYARRFGDKTVNTDPKTVRVISCLVIGDLI